MKYGGVLDTFEFWPFFSLSLFYVAGLEMWKSIFLSFFLWCFGPMGIVREGSAGVPIAWY